MIKIIVFSLLLLPVFVGAQAQPEKTPSVYQIIAAELLKDCTGLNKTVAVAGFSYSDGRDSHDGGVVAERITTELVKAQKIRVIERKEIERVFEELKFQHSGAIDPDSAKEIGEMIGADWIVVGTLTELPETQLELNIRLVGVGSGEIISAINTPIRKNWQDQYRKLLEGQNKAIEKNAKDSKAFYESGIINNDLKEYDRAIANLGIAITINPVYWEAYRARAVAYVYGASDWDKAIDDVNKAIEINPQAKSGYGATSYRIRGILYFQKGEYGKTINDSTKAIEINPKDAYAYYWRGRALYMNSEHDKAIEDLTKAIEFQPDLRDAYEERGWNYYRESKRIVDADAQAKVTDGYLKAIEDFTKAIFIGPTAAAYNGRGLAYSEKGNSDKAINDLKMAIKLNPEDKPRLQIVINGIELSRKGGR